MSKGTAHHKAHNITGWGLIIGLPFAIFSAVKAIGAFAIFSAVKAIGGGSEGFITWLSTPLGAIGFLAFVLAAAT